MMILYRAVGLQLSEVFGADARRVQIPEVERLEP